MTGLNLVKLCVGISDVAHLHALQTARVAAGQMLCHRTRNFPRRANELRDGGSLYWVIKGKINRDIGDILGSSPMTVKKHLEHVFVKLGVETRTAAAGMAMSRIRQLHPQFEG